MNNTFKNISIFVIGAAIGAFAGVVICRKRAEQVCEQLLQEELAAVREYSERKKDERPKNKVVKERFQKEELSSLINRYNGGDTEAANAMADVPERTRDDSYHDHKRLSQDANNGDSAIYVITTEQFSEERPEYDKLTISYYEDDDTLADENEDPIADPVSLIGDALENFGEGSDDPQVVYVRNERISIDYEVIRLSKSYASTVGIGWDG